MAFYEEKHGFDADYFTVESKRDLNFPDHVHRCLELVCVEEGRMVVTVEEKEWILTAGDCILIWSAQVHSFRSEGHSRHTLCVFAPELVRRFFTLHTAELPLCPVLRGEKAAVCRSLLLSLHNGDEILRAKGILYLLAGELEKHVVFRKRARGRHEESAVLMTQMLAYMNENFTGDCSIGRMAEELCYEKTYLAKLFSKTVGLPPAQYVLQLRLARACELLLSTSDHIINVGSASGFASLRAFNRNFMERYGMTPTQFRAAHAGKSPAELDV